MRKNAFKAMGLARSVLKVFFVYDSIGLGNPNYGL